MTAQQHPRGPRTAAARRPRSGPRLTLSQSLWTSDSASCLQDIKLSIQPSRVGMVVGSRLRTGEASAGARPTSSILVSMALGRG